MTRLSLIIILALGLGAAHGQTNKKAISYFQIAQKFEENGKLDSALMYFNKADSIAPNTPIILHERGLLKSSLELFKEAIKDIDKSIELTKDEKQKLVFTENRGLTYLDMGEKDKACADFKAIGNFGNGKKYIEKYCK